MFHKIIIHGTTVFNINNITKFYLFLKDQVTLKTGVMMLKIMLCHHRNIFLSNKCIPGEHKRFILRVFSYSFIISISIIIIIIIITFAY